MEPVPLLLQAVALGAVREPVDGESDALKIAYRELMRLLTDLFGEDESACVVLSQYAFDPGTWRAPLAKALVAAGASSDESVISAARHLMTLIGTMDAESAEYRVALHGVRGMQIGESNHQINIFAALPGMATLTQEGASSNETFRADAVALLQALDMEARTGRLPPYLPRDADVSRLARTVRARRGIRTKLRLDDPDESQTVRAYMLPVERADSSEPVRPWPEVAREYKRLIVLGDPGLGKSWLIRTETHRLSAQALDAEADGAEISALLIPVPLRCDQLVAQSGQTLGEAAARFLVSQGLLHARSQRDLRNQVDAGGVVMLLDALDELVSEQQYTRLAALLREWQMKVGDQARCVITSRIAGFRGTPLVDAHEVELQAFTPEDVTEAVKAWRLPKSAAERVMTVADNPGVAGMTRVPLLLALLCSLATTLPEGRRLPASRGELYEQVLRWFLARAHRAGDQEGGAALPAGEVDDLLGILAPVAFHFAASPDGWVDLMQADELKNAVRLVGQVTGFMRPASVIVRELSTGAGIFVPVGNSPVGQRSSYLFLHRTIAEYLVARQLATLPTADRLDIVDRHLWFDPDWAEVLPLLGGQLDPVSARDLIAHLLSQTADPFHCALLTAVRVIAERADPNEVLPLGAERKVADGILSVTERPAAENMSTFLSGASSRLPQRVVYEIAKRLDDPEAGIRMRAVQLLAERYEPTITKQLTRRLTDTRPYVRLAAVEAMRGRNEEPVNRGLLACLRDSDLEVRWASARILGTSKNPEITPGLLTSLEATDPGVRMAATWALAQQDDSSATEALLNLLRDSDHDVRAAAVEALAARSDSSFTEALLGCLEDSSAIVRIAAVTALASRDEISVTDHLLACFDDSHAFVRVAIVKALSGREAAIVTDTLLAALSDWNSDVQSAVFWELAKRAESTVIEAILSRLTASAGWWVYNAIEWLSWPVMSPYTDRLIACLGDPDPDVRTMAARALSGRREPDVTIELLGLLQDKDREVRAVAARSLAGNSQVHVINGMLNAANDPDPIVRKSVIDALQSQMGGKVTEVLLRCCDDAHLSVRVAAVSALATRREDHVTDCLLRCVDSPHASLRAASIRALAGREGPEIAERLLSHLDDPDPIARTAAGEALVKYGQGVIDGLLTRTADPDAGIREAAIRALSGRRGDDIVQALKDRLSDRAIPVRNAAIEMLAEHDSDTVANSLLNCLDVLDWRAQNAVRRALAERNDPEITAGLIDWLNDSGAETQEKVIALLSGRKGMRVTEELIRLAAVPHASFMAHIVGWALVKRDSPEEIVAIIRQVRSFDPVILRIIYKNALQMVTRVHSRLPERSRLDVRVGLAWLTEEVSRNRPEWENIRLPPRGIPVPGVRRGLPRRSPWKDGRGRLFWGHAL